MWINRRKHRERYSKEIYHLIASLMVVHPSRIKDGIPQWRWLCGKKACFKPVPDMTNRHLLNALKHEMKKKKIGVLMLRNELGYLGAYKNSMKPLDQCHGTKEAIEKQAELIELKKAFFNSLETDVWVDILYDEIQFRRMATPDCVKFDYSDIEAFEAKPADEHFD